ncbi:MAG TPA: NUDIX domain-containing protein [Xanthobacteraceae bacterium]|nr:NUDIX domain-containing protein [Xanthobacteraceae bacterium]
MRDSMIRPVLCASAAAFRGGKLLLARRTKPPFLWSLPGGAVEWGERLAAAAMRELREETGIEAEAAGYAGHSEVLLRNEKGVVVEHFVVVAFAARWWAREARTGPEASAVAWVEPARLGDYEITEGLAPIIERAERLVR